MKVYRDHYFKKAKQENYPARSIYKLREIDSRFRIFRPGMHVLDLGAAPGSWSIGASELIGPTGRVLGADLQTTETSFPANVTFMQEDVFERSQGFEDALAAMMPLHVVMSDMAANTTGHKFTDQARSANLCREALAVATKCLIHGGCFIVKIFMGPDFHEFASEMRGYFDSVKSFKPKSSRAESKEIFYIGIGFKGRQQDGKAVHSAETEAGTPD